MKSRVTKDILALHVLERAGIFGEHAGRAIGQRGIDEDRGGRNAVGVDQRGDINQQFLRALEREHRNDEIATARQRPLDLGFQQGSALADGEMVALAVAVGGFADDMIEPRRTLRIALKRLMLGTKVTGTQDMPPSDIELNRRRAQDVPGVPKARPEPGDLKPCLELNGPGLPPRGHRVLLGVDRYDLWLVRTILASIASGCVALLDAPRVGQHELEQIRRWRRAPDLAREAFGHEPGQ